MCGLFGMAGKGITAKDTAIFNNLGIVTQLRGTDGAGVYIDKVCGPPLKTLPRLTKSGYDFCDLKADSEYFATSVADVFIGHCRAATVGTINEANAHPFEHGEYIVAHNGTLFHPEYNKDPSITDSEQMVQDMSKIGVIDSLEKLSHWDAFAISALDKTSGALHFARNSQRPLFLALSESRDVMWWCSEDSLLEMVLNRSNAGKYTVFELAEDTHYEVQVDHIKAGKHKIFYITDLEYKDPFGVERYKGRSDTDDVFDTCVGCNNKLKHTDLVYGWYSNQLQGLLCETCSYGGQSYAS